MSLYHQLQTYSSSFAEEHKYKQLILEFLATGENHFSRKNLQGHITASAFLLNSDCSKFFLMHHAKLGKWLQPGGHCDGNQNTLEVAIKEAMEESGIEKIQPISNNIFDIDVHLIPANHKEQAHHHYDVRFLLKAVDNDNLVQNHEAKELRWVGLEEHKNSQISLEPSILRMLEKFQANNA